MLSKSVERFREVKAKLGWRIFLELHWRNYYAPVVPPKRVVLEAERTQQPIDWENTRTVDGEPFPMLYRTILTNRLEGGIVTHLRPGSLETVDVWLRKVPDE